VLDDAEEQATAELLFELLPRRRSRQNPRVVKRKMSNFCVTRPEHRGVARAERSVRVVVTEAAGE
jgi:hypothetical protein